jgi:hypothetical protein
LTPPCFTLRAADYGGSFFRRLPERLRLPLPPGIVGEPVVRKFTGSAHYGEIGLDLAVAALRFLD